MLIGYTNWKVQKKKIELTLSRSLRFKPHYSYWPQINLRKCSNQPEDKE
jgi:hypothetical protein